MRRTRVEVVGALNDLRSTVLSDLVASAKTVDLSQRFDPHGCFVYFLWGSRRSLLYVGRSTNVLVRLGNHLREAGKRKEISQVTVVRCEDRKAMNLLEATLIREHRPPWNILGVA